MDKVNETPIIINLDDLEYKKDIKSKDNLESEKPVFNCDIKPHSEYKKSTNISCIICSLLFGLFCVLYIVMLFVDLGIDLSLSESKYNKLCYESNLTILSLKNESMKDLCKSCIFDSGARNIECPSFEMSTFLKFMTKLCILCPGTFLALSISFSLLTRPKTIYRVSGIILIVYIILTNLVRWGLIIYFYLVILPSVNYINNFDELIELQEKNLLTDIVVEASSLGLILIICLIYVFRKCPPSVDNVKNQCQLLWLFQDV